MLSWLESCSMRDKVLFELHLIVQIVIIVKAILDEEGIVNRSNTLKDASVCMKDKFFPIFFVR